MPKILYLTLFGSSTADCELTVRSGLLEPADSVMADRGFTIADLLEERGVTEHSTM